ncbi:AT-hook motif nuclear-localized protein 1 [Hibiscus syriacus]|uniref:AT-hook motif nuclear-localized protein n=1 Tax=Hibiscus syriacus TaxID=106335 RepID=A0A6A2Y3A2_HIBSY|nr:AT-hook motif nuclear-localized protein 1-like [Hibiscus syriacus]XP_039045934.1 AT-hook motif nuclear-localized protein 1-like [Hibiscus syriacus]KAE8662704.1 AT-hook motif nuclear-localized protein 1 [Hibiscus syriacus]
MEPKEFETTAAGAATAGVTVVGSDAPSAYHIAPRAENSTKNPNPVPGSAPSRQQAAQPGVPPPVLVTGMPEKKKRGRPRKYGPDGSITKALSPKPISTAAPPPSVIDFSAGKGGKVKSPTSFSKPRNELENLGEWVACSVGANFTPHIITVNAGEDVTMKIISFSQQGPRAICILSANGVISSVTLRQPDSSGGTLTYEGRFEILSLSGSFMPNESGATRSRSGGMSVSLASPDGRVVGGGVAGLLVAAGPVQVVVGSFLAGNQHEQNLKKQKPQSMTISAATTISVATPVSIFPISSADPKLNISSSFRTDTWSPTDSKKKPTDINASVHGA